MIKTNIKNKIILITGSSRGIGKYISLKLSKNGALVILNSRNKKELDNIAKEIPNSFSVSGDVCDPRQCELIIEKIISKFGRLDGLVCNVGSGKSVKPGYEYNEEWKRIFDMNFFSCTNIIEASKKYLADKDSSIVCISSICGMETIPFAPITYSVAKSALNAYVASIAKPLSKQKIRINAIAPGNILFEGSTWDVKYKKNPENIKIMLKEKVPLEKFGEPSDVADLVLYLISPISKFCTGSIFKIDGGQTNSF